MQELLPGPLLDELVIEMASLEEQARKMEFKNMMITLIVAAMGFVAGLFWRDAIMETINQLIPEGEGLIYKYIVAIIATIIIIILIFVLVKLQEVRIEKMLPIKKRA